MSHTIRNRNKMTKENNQFKHRNFIAMDMCNNRQFRNRIHTNKKKVIGKFNLTKELRNY